MHISLVSVPKSSSSYSLYNANVSSFPRVLYHHWTTCQTLSILLHFEDNKEQTNNLSQVHKQLEEYYQQLGFDNAFYQCSQYGYFCNLKRDNLSSIPVSPLLSRSSLIVFFVLPETENSLVKFRKLNFSSLYQSPFLQILYRISYNLSNVRVADDKSLQVYDRGRMAFMCKFCNGTWPIDPQLDIFLKAGYPFSDFPFVCQDTFRNCRATMRKIYLRSTGDGKKVLYFLHKSSTSFGLTQANIIVNTFRSSRSTLEIVQATNNIDAVILSVLSENMPNSKGKIQWHLSSFLPGISLITGINTTYGLLEAELQSFNFLTCYRKSVKVGPYVYIRPFKMSVWLALLTCVILTEIIFKYHSINQKLGSQTITLVIISFLLSTTVSYFKFRNVKIYQWLILVWLFSSVILNNAYRGQNFAKVVAPKLGRELTKFQELTGFSLYSDAPVCSNRRDLFCSKFGKAVSEWVRYKIGNEDFNSKFMMKGREKSEREFNFTFLEDYDFQGDKTSRMIAVLASHIAPLKTEYYPKGIETAALNVGKSIGDCDKSAFAAPKEEIRSLLKHLAKDCTHISNIYMGNDALFKRVGTWYVQESGGRYFQRRMRYLEYSGIYNFWKKWIEPKITKGDDKCVQTIRKVALSRDSGIAVICYVYIFGCLFSFVVLVSERLI
ncbi:unnamed protein product [Orchesella dallaii]|uniref:Uncharacterized protein n=1 Tax=Orchesella dallaii TaxID=48710 RepID=A0ABP1RIN0_9HEXA